MVTGPVGKMESSARSCFVVLVVLATTVCADESQLVVGKDSSQSKTFDCYFCSTSHGDEDVYGACGTPNNLDTLYNYKNCAGVCTKNVVYDTDTDTIVSINRLCESKCPGDRHCTQEAHGRKTCSYCCTSQLCNSTTKVGINHAAVAFFALVVSLSFANTQW